MAGIEEIKAVFIATGGADLKLRHATLAFENDAQILGFAGEHADGKPFGVMSAPFTGDPIRRAQEIAQDLIRTHTGWPTGPATRQQMATDPAPGAPAPVAVKPTTPPRTAPLTVFSGLRGMVRQQIAEAAREAAALTIAVPAAMAELKGEMKEFRGLVDEVKATTAELRGARQAEGDNGAPSSDGSSEPQGT